jgi:serine phosphatase RsbU (regulator of sigma subunit)/anti-anti-sigma regulatory factor
VTPPDRPAEPPVPSILIVDDDENLRQLLARALRGDEPRHIEEAASAAEARASLLRRPFDVVITDLSMPEEGGLSLMQWSHEHRPGPSWIVLTGYGTLDTAVKALQLGAFDFLAKPMRGFEPLRNAVRNALAHQRLLAERDRLHAELQESNSQLREHVEQLEEACRLLRTQADTIRADLQRAGIIQRALLPQTAPNLSDFHVHALYRPSQNVGGDLYDVARLDDRRVVLLIADAAGHGLSAAMLAVLFRSQLPFVDPDSRAPHDPRDVLRAVNRSLCEALPAPGLFLTAIYCLLDTERREVTVASAGHPPLFWIRRQRGIERVFHTGPALGLYPDADFTQKRIALERGDGLLLYSDGLYERFSGGDGPPSGRIAAALQRKAEPDPSLFERLLAPSRDFEADGDDVPQDDVTLLMLTAAPGTSVLDNGTPQSLPAPAVLPSGCQILMGADSRHTVLCVQGRGDWSQSAAFHLECATAIEKGRDVMIDLPLCRHLDSTFLGTIHQLCELAEAESVELRLQGVMPPVEDLFEELGMDLVMDHIVARMLPLPTKMEPLDPTEPDPSTRALLLLRAHEGLAALSDRNRQEFDPLVALLRKEVAGLTR